jgi:uncharacterized membrane protein YraQ (UPF0718 family)/YHS domain-containing protein
VTILLDLVRAGREALGMLWLTLWPLILGFTLAGAVQAFVSRDTMRQKLGDHRVPSVLRASGYGMASSSCSYAAAAVARSLVARGADFVTAMVFMFASTNLVIELGIVLAVLIGWQFAVGELVGGIVMIALLATIGALWLRGRVVVEAQRRAGDAGAGSTEAPASPRRRAGWSEAARYTMGDLRMVRWELLVGYGIAGLLAVVVPSEVWRAVFVSGHGFWTSLENAVVGPLVALVASVCSIGNVPLAAALWAGGISFGGVIAFVFADLIAFPILLIYRRYYGTAMALRMLLVFWAVMSAAGLVTEYLFRAAGLVPTVHHAVPAGSLSFGPTTVLNVLFLGVLVGLYVLSRRPGAASTAVDPVCGMQVRTTDAPASSRLDAETVYFCSERCRDRFTAAAVPAVPSR